MNILIVGNGGREAALVHFLQQSSSHPHTIHVSPQMDSYPHVISSHIAPNNHKEIHNYILKNQIELVVVGPELPLWEGLSDFLRAQDVPVFGPSKAGAQLECSKLSCKKFLIQAGIPTSPYEEVFDLPHLLERSILFQPPWILKVDGLAAGKGVYICKTKEELQQAGEDIFLQKKLGSQRVFLENYLPGEELSYLVLTNGTEFAPLPLSQDHKRIFDADQGPNTGGMGAVAPLRISEDLSQKIQSRIVKPFVQELEKQKILYRGVIYFGIMVSSDGAPYVLEINARLGDPEAQVILPLIENDGAQLLWDIAHGNLPTLSIKDQFASCVVLAAPGYPESPQKNLPIEGEFQKTLQPSSTAYLLPAGVSKSSDTTFTTGGGRVLNAIGIGTTASESLNKAYELTKKVHWSGMQFRKDIGKKVLTSEADFEFSC